MRVFLLVNASARLLSGVSLARLRGGVVKSLPFPEAPRVGGGFGLPPLFPTKEGQTY